ncbi:hypothetical protein QMM58_05775 [Clostridioides difficile]|nr:hypothetical protein [Clostridioides difficile]
MPFFICMIVFKNYNLNSLSTTKNTLSNRLGIMERKKEYYRKKACLLNENVT